MATRIILATGGAIHCTGDVSFLAMPITMIVCNHHQALEVKGKGTPSPLT
jgi:hypothetical protein